MPHMIIKWLWRCLSWSPDTQHNQPCSYLPAKKTNKLKKQALMKKCLWPISRVTTRKKMYKTHCWIGESWNTSFIIYDIEFHHYETSTVSSSEQWRCNRKGAVVVIAAPPVAGRLSQGVVRGRSGEETWVTPDRRTREKNIFITSPSLLLTSCFSFATFSVMSDKLPTFCMTNLQTGFKSSNLKTLLCFVVVVSYLFDERLARLCDQTQHIHSGLL